MSVFATIFQLYRGSCQYYWWGDRNTRTNQPILFEYASKKV